MLTDFAAMEVVECPYLPEGFVVMTSPLDKEFVILNTKTGIVFKVPKFTLEPTRAGLTYQRET